MATDDVRDLFEPGEYYKAGGLPIPLTVSALEAFLRDRKFEVQNNRATGGGLWVKADAASTEIAEALGRLGVECRIALRRNWPGEWILVDHRRTLP